MMKAMVGNSCGQLRRLSYPFIIAIFVTFTVAVSGEINKKLVKAARVQSIRQDPHINLQLQLSETEQIRRRKGQRRLHQGEPDNSSIKQLLQSIVNKDTRSSRALPRRRIPVVQTDDEAWINIIQEILDGNRTGETKETPTTVEGDVPSATIPGVNPKPDDASDSFFGGVVTPPTIAPFNVSSSSPNLNSFVPSDAPSTAPSDFPSVFPSSGIASLYGTMIGEAACDEFFSGSPIPSNASTDVYNISLSVLFDNRTNYTSIGELVLQVLNEEIAPALAGCEARNSRELITNSYTLESNSSRYTNLLGISFHSPTKVENDTACSGVLHLTCIHLSIICDISYDGDELESFPKVLRRQLLFWDWNSIPSWSGIRAIRINQTNSNGTTSRESGGDDGPTDIQGVTSTSTGNWTRTAAILSAAVAAAVVTLITYLVLRRKKDKVEKEFQDLQLTDDEYCDDKCPTNDIPLEKSYVVTGGDEADKKDELYDDEATEILAMRIEENIYSKKSMSLDDSLTDNYPTRYLVTNGIDSYDSMRDDGTATMESNNRSYRLPDNTIDL